ncbi:MAG: hypothetical protein ACTSPM_01445 [Candidatus Heimdallarchaeota archaeon]
MTQTTNIEKNEVQKKNNWLSITALILIGVSLILIISFTFMRSAAEITAMILEATSALKIFFIVTHALFLVTLVIGFPIKKIRKYIFFGYILFLSVSAFIVSIVFVIVPNIVIFGLFTSLIIYAFINKKINFNLKEVSIASWFFGITALLFGFWYLHWIDDPIWLNALLYSPLGGINCPTMVAVCGFLILQSKPRSHLLDFVVGFITCYFGFFGVFRLAAYVDIALILCGGFLVVRTIVDKIQLTKNQTSLDGRKVNK